MLLYTITSATSRLKAAIKQHNRKQTSLQTKEKHHEGDNMSYEKPLTPTQYSEIAQYITKLKEMQAGSTFTLTGFGKDLSRVRFLIYKWLFHNGLKHSFRISYETPTRIQILRRAKPSITMAASTAEELLAQFVSYNLSETPNAGEAMTIIREGVATGTLPPDLILQAFQDWETKIKPYYDKAKEGRSEE